MRETEIRQVKTIQARDVLEFDELYNRTAKELGHSITEVRDLDAVTARFYYTEVKRDPEDIEDEFELCGVYATCGDCPFLQVTDDARRKWFRCDYAKYGESCIDSKACAVFYKEAVKRMRETR